jgi:23S rRNA (guanosine2251-2'-O)-methyltransferase
VLSDAGEEIGIEIDVAERTVRGGARAFDRDGPRRRSRDEDGADERPAFRPRRSFGDRDAAEDEGDGPRGRRGTFRPREDRPMGPGGLVPGGTGIGGRGGFGGGGFGGGGPRQGGPRSGGFGSGGPRAGGFGAGGPRGGGFAPGGPRTGPSRGGPGSRDDDRRPPWRDRDGDDRRPPRRDRDEGDRRPASRGAPFGARRDARDAYDDDRPPARRSGPPGDLLYGRNAVLEALRAGRPIRRVMVATGAHGEVITEIVDEARAKKINLQSVDRRRLDDLAFNHQGVIAEAAPYVYASLEDVIEAAQASATPLVLVLDVLQDPQNLGSLLRTAAAAGAQGVVIPEHRAVGVTPAVVKASAGAIERLKIAQVTNLSRAIDALKEVGIWAVGLDAGAETPYDTADLDRPLALVVGGEGKGLRPLVRQHCDLVVSLPMPGAIESLNAAVAGSIVLYEALRQRGQKPPESD